MIKLIPILSEIKLFPSNKLIIKFDKIKEDYFILNNEKYYCNIEENGDCLIIGGENDRMEDLQKYLKQNNISFQIGKYEGDDESLTILIPQKYIILDKKLSEIKVVGGKLLIGYIENRKNIKKNPIKVRAIEKIKFPFDDFEAYWIEYPIGYLNIAIKNTDFDPHTWWINPEVGMEEASNWDYRHIINFAKKHNLKLKDENENI